MLPSQESPEDLQEQHEPHEDPERDHLGANPRVGVLDPQGGSRCPIRILVHDQSGTGVQSLEPPNEALHLVHRQLQVVEAGGIAAAQEAFAGFTEGTARDGGDAFFFEQTHREILRR